MKEKVDYLIKKLIKKELEKKLGMVDPEFEVEEIYVIVILKFLFLDTVKLKIKITKDYDVEIVDIFYL